MPAALVDEGAALLDFAGFGGVEIRGLGAKTDLVVVVCAADDAASAARAAEARNAIAILDAGLPRIVELDPKVWTENWKRHFARRTFAGRIEVYPPWESPSPASSELRSIVINPGMAFGTGLHETTASCLELLVEEMRPGMSVADVGCGSGILAIAAAKLGAARVLATDVDPLAVDAALENVTANAVHDAVRVELEPGELSAVEWEHDARLGLAAAREAVSSNATRAVSAQHHDRDSGTGFASAGPFDLVVANILAETLVEMRDALASAVGPGGVLVLSGIEARRLKMVQEAFIRSPWRLARTVTKGDWVAVSLHHDALAEPVRGPSVHGEITSSRKPLKK